MANENEMTTEVYGVPIGMRTREKASRALKKFRKKYKVDDQRDYPLRARDNAVLAPVMGLKEIYSAQAGDAVNHERAVVIGTIRMGYGHYRIGMALASAAAALGYVPHWFDLLAFDSAGARMIRDLDKWYSLGSRWSQKSRLFNNLLWDPLMGKWYKRLEKNYPIMKASAIFADTHRALPPTTPFLATHPFNAHGALHAGLERVVNVVPDNCPLGFHIAPGALHTVQSPSAYFIFRTLRDLGAREAGHQGIPADEVFMAGHYIDHELVANIDADCDGRRQRMDSGAPRRLLISIGGAGAQQDLIAGILDHLMPQVRTGRVALFVNCGDHTSARDHFQRHVAGFTETARCYTTWEDTCAFAQAAATAEIAGLHVFLNSDPFAAVYATNMLMRVADLLVTKPSELAFYPIPKLLLERVGGHEAWGAIRAAELGDGTPECAGAPLTLQALDRMINERDLLELYCAQIQRLRDLGVYDGAYHAVELATTGKFQTA